MWRSLGMLPERKHRRCTQGVIDLTAFLGVHVPFKGIAIEKAIVMQGLNNLTGLTLDELSLADSDDYVK